MEPLDLYATPLQGLNLIEASAGTGKTYTISALYLRMIAELGLPVERILVVTYTKAATAELRDRIRRKLVEARLALAADTGGEQLRGSLAKSGIDPELSLRRLNHAILGFDRAAIFTIHGFCQRVLADNAFASGRPFETELIPEESRLIQEVVDDFWRLHIQQLSPGMLDYLLAQRYTPDTLALFLKGKLGKPYLLLRGCPKPVGLEGIESNFMAVFREARELWREAGETIGQMLQYNTGLNGNRYRKNAIPGWLSAMNQYLAELPGPWFDAFEKFCSRTLADSVKKNETPPQHPFFDCCQHLQDARVLLIGAYRQKLVQLLQSLVEYTDAELAKRKSQRGLQSYDDLLLNLRQALQGDSREALLAEIRRHYGAALIDEFQDTDPLQYAIFREIYLAADAPVFLVGDPKQAIYSFRGADIFAYLKAARDAQARYSLERSWRSGPQLLTALNKLFNQNDRAFIYKEISYVNVLAAETRRELLAGDDQEGSALRIGLLEGNLTADEALEQAVLSAAAEVCRLLKLGARGLLRIGSRPLAGGDIALLVRTHRQGALIKQALRVLGINSVQNSQEDVFHSQAAVQMERLLKAVLYPAREGLVRAALTTCIIGVDGNRLALMEEGELEAFMDAFHGYHKLWGEQGFMRMFRRLLSEQGTPARLLRFEEGERLLTDLMHLAELLHQYEREGRPGMELLLNWFTRQCQAEIAESEASQLRLESDDQLVQIVTIHKSKGLEYPVVFYPFGWEGGAREIDTGAPYAFHDPGADFRPILDLGSQEWERDRGLAQAEMLAESVRLLYVALTRARHRCYLYWGKVKGGGRSPVTWLLHPPAEPWRDDLLAAMARHFSTLEERDIAVRIERLARESDGAISVHQCCRVAALPAVDQIERTEEVLLSARQFRRHLSNARRMTSFSALSGSHASVELPDYDRVDGAEEIAQEAPATRSIFQFPRGARAGSCLHAVFERIDFTRCARAVLEQLAAQQLAAHGMDVMWQGAVCDMVERVLATPLDQNGEIFLARVPAERRLVEMAFHYPLDRINGAGLSRLLLEHGLAGDEGLRSSLGRIGFGDVQGFMKGFIDLVFESGGRFYLLDYKSNWLGDEPSHYGRPQMAQAMQRENYTLQYLFYTLALHRYLRKRIPGYHYDSHFGAVIYLFLRGVDPHAGTGTGVYRERPDIDLIEALDRYIGHPHGVPL